MTLHAKHPRKPCGVLTTYHKFIFPKNLRKNESELSPCPTRSYCIILAGAKSGAHRGAPNHGHAGRPAWPWFGAPRCAPLLAPARMMQYDLVGQGDNSDSFFLRFFGKINL